MPGASRYKDIYKAVIDAEEGKHNNENGELRGSEDMNDSGIIAVNPSSPQQPIMSIEDDEFPSDDEKVGI